MKLSDDQATAAITAALSAPMVGVSGNSLLVSVLGRVRVHSRAPKQDALRQPCVIVLYPVSRFRSDRASLRADL